MPRRKWIHKFVTATTVEDKEMILRSGPPIDLTSMTLAQLRHGGKSREVLPPLRGVQLTEDLKMERLVH